MIGLKKWIAPAAIVLGALSIAACDVEQTEEGSMPEVDVSAEGGNMPEYDVETADVDVGTKEKTVEVPDVDVTMPDEQEERPEQP
ncbi:hypothetical protein KEM63_08320 [Halopseudomonas nanhaiensis]|uniref:hypothetical protein n=1 Tax=Halopseudomonas nanhaiensis TaxID=2830842 RepID=UPI001CBBB75E|nr:hypothetical protein [Halopseudomonas nanhaiensis]UAW96854.1 hypothetical protein KEM63_08320 [Halopseudomonas nanhaiensis]